jgi:putative intracellular protease/amidase
VPRGHSKQAALPLTGSNGDYSGTFSVDRFLPPLSNLLSSFADRRLQRDILTRLEKSVHPARVRGHVGRGDKPRISFYQAEVAAAADLIALFKALVVSLRSGEIKGWNHKEWGETMAVDKTVDSVDAKNCDALLLPGGVMNPDTLRMDAKAVAFVKAFFAAKKPVAAICHGPWTIVEAGAAKGRTLTSWPSLKTDIQNAGGGRLGRPRDGCG